MCLIRAMPCSPVGLRCYDNAVPWRRVPIVEKQNVRVKVSLTKGYNTVLWSEGDGFWGLQERAS
jgi:hypothetical protein